MCRVITVSGLSPPPPHPTPPLIYDSKPGKKLSFPKKYSIDNLSFEVCKIKEIHASHLILLIKSHRNVPHRECGNSYSIAFVKCYLHDIC